jgi:hypothetical protein
MNQQNSPQGRQEPLAFPTNPDEQMDRFGRPRGPSIDRPETKPGGLAQPDQRTGQTAGPKRQDGQQGGQCGCG